jgi:hypothetical protein
MDSLRSAKEPLFDAELNVTSDLYLNKCVMNEDSERVDMFVDNELR